MSNPFQSIVKGKPVAAVTDYHKDVDKYIIEYVEKEFVKVTDDSKKGELGDDGFIITKKVVEASRTDRQAYIDSFADDVGILNIMKKVALSGDESLLNQTHRVSMPGNSKDALGRAVEDIVDVTKYQVDQVDALESYKVGAAVYNQLDPELKKKMSFEEVAKMSDTEIDAYLNGIREKVLAIQNANKKEGD